MKEVGRAICIWIGIFVVGNLLLWAAMSWLPAFVFRDVNPVVPVFESDFVYAVIALGVAFNVFMGAMLVLWMILLVTVGIQLGVRGMRKVRLRQRSGSWAGM